MATGHGKVLQYTRHGLRMVGDSASLFDLNEPVWHPDEKSSHCDKCKNKFSFTNRRHHCRRCGDVICGECSEKQPLQRMGFVDPVLVCNVCAQICRNDEDFFKHHLKLLENGAYFKFSDTDQIYNCKLSSNHFDIIVTEGYPSIHMPSILELKTNTLPGHSPEAPGKLSSLQLTYQDHDGKEKVVTLSPSPSHSRKQSIDWLKALKKGLMMIHSSKDRRSLSLSDSVS